MDAILKAVTVGVACAVLAACGPLIELPGSGPAPRIFFVTSTPVEAVPTGATSSRPVLIVHEPDMPAALAVDRIAVVPQDHELNYLADARWIDRAPKLIQSFLVDSLNNLGNMTATAHSTAKADYQLFVHINRFQVEIGDLDKPSQVVVTARIFLVDSATGEFLSVDEIERRREIDAVTPIAAVEGFDAVLTALANDLADLTKQLRPEGTRPTPVD